MDRDEGARIIYALADFTEEDGMKAAELEHEFRVKWGGYTAESDAATLMGELGVSEQYHAMLMKDIPAVLKVRVLLAQALFGNPDILLLDEPTNGLDIETISWQRISADYENIVLVVSHDRHFLDAVCTRSGCGPPRKSKSLPATMLSGTSLHS